jgi:hypothetical protein
VCFVPEHAPEIILSPKKKKKKKKKKKRRRRKKKKKKKEAKLPIKEAQVAHKKRSKLPIFFLSWPFVGPVFGIYGIVSNPCPFQPIVGIIYFGLCGIV